jgi:Domain of unknown function (DUF5054)
VQRRDFVKSMAISGAGLLVQPNSLFELSAQSAQPVQPDPTVRRVLVMFKCHFDAGFIDTQTHVVHKYFTQYFPQAIEIARAANASGKRRYVWTTGSWLLFEYLDWAAQADRKTMEDAIARGDIAWHALPFNWQTEMMDRSMIVGSLTLSRSLDRRFGKTTTGAKMTDVPGHTRAIVPPLAEQGVKFLEIGVNGGSMPAEVPPLFLWKDPSGASLPMMYHHEYGGVAVVPGSDLALVTEVRGDNSGPHKPAEIDQIFAALGARFPKAEIVASNLSEMADALYPHRAALPVVTREIGDTWIYGCASDPLKVARYRAVARLRQEWITQGRMEVGDATDIELLRHALLEAEHTWGTDTKTWLDFNNYKPADLARMLDTKNYKVVQFSWQEKRQDLLDAVASLPAPLRGEAQKAIDDQTPIEPTLSSSASIHPPATPLETAHFILGLDAATGALIRLHSKSDGREWASASNPIGLVTYQTLSQEDYMRYRASYLVTTADWAQKDFGKPNIEKFGARNEEWHPRTASLQMEETQTEHRILVSPLFEDQQAFQSGRASFPRKIFIEMRLPKGEPAIHLTVFWFGKPATRLPEALWLTFNPIAEDPRGWKLDKSGEWISPFDVVISGNRHMHALQKGFAYNSAGHNFAVDTLDTPVVAVGKRSPLLFSNDQPDLARGIHSCLFNNAWGTNYIMWYGENARARFVLRA